MGGRQTGTALSEGLKPTHVHGLPARAVAGKAVERAGEQGAGDQVIEAGDRDGEARGAGAGAGVQGAHKGAGGGVRGGRGGGGGGGPAAGAWEWVRVGWGWVRDGG